MTPVQAALLDALVSRFGPGIATTDPADIAPWLTDWRGRYTGAAPAILQPATTAQVAAVVAASAAHGVPIVPQGGNTSMVGGATPPADGSALIVSTRRLRRIRAVDADGCTAVVEAGVILADLHAAAAAAGRRFPLTLGARGSATIGGLVSTAAGGTQVLRWGTMRALTLGVEAVLPDGSVHDGLAALAKDTRGYGIDALLVGAEGTLGIVTAATLRLAPAIGTRFTAWAGVATPHDALDVLRALQGAATIESFEILPASSLAAALAYLPAARSPLVGDHAWHVLVEAVADPGAPPPPLADLLGPLHDRELVRDAAVAASEAQADAFWALRDTLSAAERALGPAVQHDIAVPVAAMPDLLVGGARAVEAAFPGTHAGGFGHLGDGNVHFHVRAPAGVDPAAWYADAAPAITAHVHDRVVAMGGTIAAEHGIGQMKRDELARTAGPARLAALRAIKRAFDPDGRLNPGKLVAPA